jgi:hypothetical protein
MIDEHEYNEEHLYNCDETAFYCRMLPIKLLDINKYGNQQRKGAFLLDQVKEKTRTNIFSSCEKHAGLLEKASSCTIASQV